LVESRSAATLIAQGNSIPEEYRWLIQIGLAVRFLIVFICVCMLYLMVYKPNATFLH